MRGSACQVNIQKPNLVCFLLKGVGAPEHSKTEMGGWSRQAQNKNLNRYSQLKPMTMLFKKHQWIHLDHRVKFGLLALITGFNAFLTLNNG